MKVLLSPMRHNEIVNSLRACAEQAFVFGARQLRPAARNEKQQNETGNVTQGKTIIKICGAREELFLRFSAVVLLRFTI